MYYGSKSKTKPKPKEPQRSPRIIGLGLVKLDFYLNLTDEQIKQFKIDFSKINGPKDLAFIAEDPALLDLIQISSSDTLSNILLYLNKASIQKSFVELITLSPLRIHPDEEHMKKIFTHVTEHNYLFSNEMSVTSVPNKISFAFKNGKKLLKYFDIITDYDPYTDDILLEDTKKITEDKLNNVYSNLMNSSTSKSKNKNEIKEIENYNHNLKNKMEDKSARNQQDYEEDDILVRDDIYNDMSDHLEMSKHKDNNNKRLFDDELNYKINEVHDEEEQISNHNMSVRKTQSRKSLNLNDNEENIENEASNSEDMGEHMSEKGQNMELNEKSNLSQNKSKITNKTQSKKENKSNLNQEENLENNPEQQLEDDEQINKEEVMERSEKASNVESKILKTNSVNRDLNEIDAENEKKKDGEEMEEDFNIEDLEEIKDENFNTSNLKTQSKKKELTQLSQRSEDEFKQEKSKQSSFKFQEPYEKKQSSNKPLGEGVKNENSQNSKIMNNNDNNKSISRKYDSMNYGNNEDIKKNIRPLYEGADLNKNEKSTISGSKLTNIPAACEIEEYDFLFIDLEEFINFHTNGFHLSELAEFMKKISSSEKKPRIVLNYPNILINLNVVNLELLETIMAIMSYTDIFLFEKKECLAFFNMLNQMNYEKDLNEKQLTEYFFKEVPHQKAAVSKLGLFLDELQKFTVAEQKKDKIINNLSYEINLFPKINHFNQKIVDEYKKIMTINNSYFKSIFFGGYFSNYIFNEDHYISYFTGAESTKRILEIFKNKIDFPTNTEFYLVKLQKNKITKDQQKEKLKQKEEKFVLDCVNKTNSSIKYYNPLFDDNLNAFFASGVIRKQLKDKGFINTNGFVLYDSSYKNLLGGPPKAKKRLDTSDRERHLLLAIKQNKELLSTDLENFSKSLKGQSPTNRKLPLPSFEMNSSNLYISSKIKNLKTSKKKLKPINTKNSNSKITNEKSIEINKTSSKSKSPRGDKKDLTTSKNNNSNSNKQQNNKSKQSNVNNTSEVLNSSLLKDREENINYKEQSKIISKGELDYEGNSENELGKSQKKQSKTYSVSMGNQRYTENSRNENDISKLNSKRDFNNSKQNTVNNYNENMEEEMNNNNNEEENKDYLERSKITHFNEENIEAENSGENNKDDNDNVENNNADNNNADNNNADNNNADNNNADNNNEDNNNADNNEEENKIEKAAEEEPEKEENANEDEMGNNADNEVNEAQEGEEEKKERNATENNLDKFESKIENEMDNMENLEQNAEAGENKEEDKVEAAGEN